MKSSTKRFYSLIAGLILLIGALFVYSSLIQPTYDEIQELRGQRQAKLDLLNDYKATADALNSLLEKYKNVSDLQNTLSMSLPIGEKAPEVFNQLQGMAIGNNMRIDSLAFQYLAIDYGEKTSLLKPMGTLRMAMKMVGGYGDLKKFLETVETNIRILDVVILSIDGGATSRNPTLNYNLVLDTRYQVEK